MLETDEGITMLVSELVNANAISPIATTLCGILYAPPLPAGKLTICDLFLLNNTPPSLEYALLPSSTFIAVHISEYANAYWPILVQDAGILNSVTVV